MISNTPNSADLNRSASITRPPRYRPVVTAAPAAAPTTSALSPSPFAPVTTTAPPGKVTDVAPGGGGGPQPYQPEGSGTTPMVPGGQSQPTPIAPPQPSAPSGGLAPWQPQTGLPGTVVTQVGPQGNPWQAGSGPVTAPVDVGSGFKGDTYAPGGDPRLQGAQDRTDAVGNKLVGAPGYNDLASQGTDRYRSVFGTVGDQGKYSAQQDQALAGISGAPSRTDAAKQALSDFDTANAEGLRNRYRDVGQNAAKFGRLGMGDTGKQAIDVGRQYEQDRMLKQNELIRSVLEGDTNDRFRTLDATSGLRGQEAGIAGDVNNQNFSRTNAAAGYGGRDATATLADNSNRVGQAQSLEDQIFGQGAANRGEMRTERGFQADQGQQDIQNRLAQRNLQNSELDARFRRGAVAAGIGGQGAPTLDEILRMYGGA